MRALRLVLAAIMVLVMVPGAPAAAEPFDADPLDLVPFADTAMRVYSQGSDAWEVWICTVPDYTPTLEASSVVAALNAEISPYFQWVSDGRYQPTFVLGGTISSDQSLQFGEPEEPFATDCQSKVRGGSNGDENGALIVVDAPFDAGYGTAGGVCPEAPFSGCTTQYPGNFREAVVTAATVSTVGPFDAPQWITVAHEMGHSLNMPHSYTGLTVDPNTNSASRYDNPMDVMSGAVHTNDPIGTHAYNRYAAGWIDPGQVAVHESGIADYQLAAIGSAGMAMVVVPSTDPGRFFVLDARRRTSYDATLPTSGVEIHEVDTRRDIACSLPGEWPEDWPCFATLVRIRQFPAQAGLSSTAHVLGIDDSETIENFTVTVTAATAGSFSIRVGELDRGTFIDDDGLDAEPDIETIAELGITQGCNPPDNDRFCPAAGVTRSEMAAFIIRALDETQNIGPYQGLFSDVEEGAWYAGYVERLAELEITTGTGPEVFAPDRVVSRAEMAAFLIRAFGTGDSEQALGVFSDVPGDAWYVTEVEELYDLGITRGCAIEPLRYCPDAQVTRAQMASFLARVLAD
ncbi:MAG: S-layer homology domain-containing protein [Acidimicrobiia bacterium]